MSVNARLPGGGQRLKIPELFQATAPNGNPDAIWAAIRRLESLVEDLNEGGGGSATLTHPFQLIDAGSGLLKVRYGTVNDVVPTMDGNALNTSPTHDVSADDGTYLVYINAGYGDDGIVTAVTVEVVLAGTLPAIDNNDDFITIGEVDVASGVISEMRQAVTHSLRHGICGRTFDETPAIVEPGIPYFWGV